MLDLSSYDFEVKSLTSNYKVTFGKLSEFVFVESDIVVTDSNLLQWNPELKSISPTLIEIESHESNKSIRTCFDILNRFATIGARKNSRIVAIGGGIIQDIITLSASLYMRGLEWVYFPTTLMSIMDSCIGGKSSINLEGHKNIIGNFYPPKLVCIDSTFTRSLSSVAISSGIAEAMKINFARSNSSFLQFQFLINSWRENRDALFLNQAIHLSLISKKWFIEIDEFDKNERKLLNFGHSFGHALEASSNFVVPHGIGVLFGMLAAVYESKNVDACADLNHAIRQELKLSGFLDSKFVLNQQKFHLSLSRDKKNTALNQVLVLPGKDGKLELITRPLNDSSLNSCWLSLRAALEDSGANYEVC